jgi:hypothetical protein
MHVSIGDELAAPQEISEPHLEFLDVCELVEGATIVCFR